MAVSKEKVKFSFWAYPETLEAVNAKYKSIGCKTRSEFIEQAVGFYIGNLAASDPSNYLPTMFLSVMNSIVKESDYLHSCVIFKLAVELSMMMNLYAAYHDVDEKRLGELRKSCTEEVAKLNGNFTFDDAVEWQKEG